MISRHVSDDAAVVFVLQNGLVAIHDAVGDAWFLPGDSRGGRSVLDDLDHRDSSGRAVSSADDDLRVGSFAACDRRDIVERVDAEFVVGGGIEPGDLNRTGLDDPAWGRIDASWARKVVLGALDLVLNLASIAKVTWAHPAQTQVVVGNVKSGEIARSRRSCRARGVDGIVSGAVVASSAGADVSASVVGNTVSWTGAARAVASLAFVSALAAS